MATDPVAPTIEAIRAGGIVVLPTDGVYGLCAAPRLEASVRSLYVLKGRSQGQPAAVIGASLEALLALVPELEGRGELLARAVLPGPYTLVLDNPARRYPWLTGDRPAAIGVRLARLPRSTQQVLDAVGALAATSANLAGGPDPARLDDVPAPIRAAAAAEIDAGTLPGRPSTVLDCTGSEPAVLREGAGPVEDALERIRAALANPDAPERRPAAGGRV